MNNHPKEFGIYTAKPIPIGQEPPKRNLINNLFYEIWWFIRGGVRKQQLKRFFRMFYFKRTKYIDEPKYKQPVNLADFYK